MAEVVDLAKKRLPVCYTVHVTQHWDDRLQVWVENVADDQRSRMSIADALRRAADLIEGGNEEP
jgi:hypothetical protein